MARHENSKKASNDKGGYGSTGATDPNPTGNKTPQPQHNVHQDSTHRSSTHTNDSKSADRK